MPKVALILLLCLLLQSLVACNDSEKASDVPDATMVSGAAAPPDGHAHPEHIPDSLDIQPSDTAVHKR